MKALRKVLLGLVALLWIFVGYIGYSAYQRHQNLKKPCVPFHQGMTLKPGQCASVTMGIQEAPGDVDADHPKPKI